MRETLALAEGALARGELPIAALVVLDDRIIASATTCETAERRLLVHAELLALEAADRLQPFPGRRRDCQLYTNLEPCMMCLGAAMSFMLGEITYALESPSDGAVALAQSWERADESFPEYRVPTITGGMLRRESIQLFQRYVDQHTSGPAWAWAKSLAKLA
jgi:tRNA(adenine34) deaminase